MEQSRLRHLQGPSLTRPLRRRQRIMRAQTQTQTGSQIRFESRMAMTWMTRIRISLPMSRREFRYESALLLEVSPEEYDRSHPPFQPAPGNSGVEQSESEISPDQRLQYNAPTAALIPPNHPPTWSFFFLFACVETDRRLGKTRAAARARFRAAHVRAECHQTYTPAPGHEFSFIPSNSLYHYCTFCVVPDPRRHTRGDDRFRGPPTRGPRMMQLGRHVGIGRMRTFCARSTVGHACITSQCAFCHMERWKSSPRRGALPPLPSRSPRGARSLNSCRAPGSQNTGHERGMHTLHVFITHNLHLVHNFSR